MKFEKNEKSNELEHFNVLAVPCDRIFTVLDDKKEEFLSVKPNLKIRQKNEEKVKKIENSLETKVLIKKK